MSASFASKLSKGHSLLGSLANNSRGLLRTSHDEIAKLGEISSPSSKELSYRCGPISKLWTTQAQRGLCAYKLSLKGKKWSMGARLGDTIIASVKEAQPRGKVKKRRSGLWRGCACCHAMRAL